MECFIMPESKIINFRRQLYSFLLGNLALSDEDYVLLHFSLFGNNPRETVSIYVRQNDQWCENYRIDCRREMQRLENNLNNLLRRLLSCCSDLETQQSILRAIEVIKESELYAALGEEELNGLFRELYYEYGKFNCMPSTEVPLEFDPLRRIIFNKFSHTWLTYFQARLEAFKNEAQGLETVSVTLPKVAVLSNEIVEALVDIYEKDESNAEIENRQTERSDNNLLHWAVYRDNARLVRWCLQAHPKWIYGRNVDGKTPFDIRAGNQSRGRNLLHLLFSNIQASDGWLFNCNDLWNHPQMPAALEQVAEWRNFHRTPVEILRRHYVQAADTARTVDCSKYLISVPRKNGSEATDYVGEDARTYQSEGNVVSDESTEDESTYGRARDTVSNESKEDTVSNESKEDTVSNESEGDVLIHEVEGNAVIETRDLLKDTVNFLVDLISPPKTSIIKTMFLSVVEHLQRRKTKAFLDRTKTVLGERERALSVCQQALFFAKTEDEVNDALETLNNDAAVNRRLGWGRFFGCCFCLRTETAKKLRFVTDQYKKDLVATLSTTPAVGITAATD